MHELSVCNALIVQVERIAARQNARSVAKIVVRIGPLSGVEPLLLQNAYPLAAAGTIAADAELAIEAANVIVSCTICGAVSAVAPNRLVCGMCGDFRTRIRCGDEMILQRIEFDAMNPETAGATDRAETMNEPYRAAALPVDS